MKDVVNPGECWQHWRAGNIYIVHVLAKLEATQDDHVVYQRVEPDGSVWGPIWVRPLKEWLDVVQVEGASYPRFMKVVTQ